MSNGKKTALPAPDAENNGAIEAARNTDGVIDTNVVTPLSMKEKKASRAHRESSSIENPHRIIKQGLFVIVAFFGVLGCWAAFGTISGAVVAPGKVKIETERKTVQHLEGGIVDSILVREGDEVTAGQTLIVLESIQVDASVDMVNKQLIALLAAQARLRAEKDMRDTVVWPGELILLAEQHQAQDEVDNELKIFKARREAIQGQISMLQSQAVQIGNQISGLEEQHAAEGIIIRTLAEELRAKRQLFKERYLEKSQILELERMLAMHTGSRGQIKQSIAESKERQDETKLRIADLTNRFVEDATNNLGRVDTEIAQAREKLRPLHNAKTRLNVIAPVSGRVVGLQVHSKGGVVRPGEPLMDVVPSDNPLIVEVQVPVNKITEVYIGQGAQVQLDAFDIRIMPLLKAKVNYISADRLEERTAAGNMPYYLCYVEVDANALDEAKAYLSPGMPATVFITTTDRTVLNYMLEPLIKNWDRALRD